MGTSEKKDLQPQNALIIFIFLYKLNRPISHQHKMTTTSFIQSVNSIFELTSFLYLYIISICNISTLVCVLYIHTRMYQHHTPDYLTEYHVHNILRIFVSPFIFSSVLTSLPPSHSFTPLCFCFYVFLFYSCYYYIFSPRKILEVCNASALRGGACSDDVTRLRKRRHPVANIVPHQLQCLL